MKRLKKILAVCIAAVIGYIVIASASPRQFEEPEAPANSAEPVENAQFIDDRQTPSYIPENTAESVDLEDEPPVLVYRTAANLRLREEPSVEAEIIETIPGGTMLLVTDYLDGGWYSVYVNGLLGYMSAEFLTFVAVRPAGSPMYMAGSATVMEAVTGEVLYGAEQHTTRYPASVTKIMTALLVLEHTEDLSELITFSESAVDIPWYASRMGMQAGDTMTVSDALYALMLVSANEVAWALAEHVSGSIEEFVDQMNLRAESLGARNTRFVNPCGLPGTDQYTTSYDMALIMREAIRHPVFTRIIATTHAYIPSAESYADPRPIRNTNRLIQHDSPEFNELVTGGKTGFTNAAQHTLVTYAEWEGRSIIVSVLYVPHRGAIFSDTATLLAHVF
ncbi:MAG: serine hydrolase [Oscillospiraceae bacterium]|nr:serine hydrolase [Oscillospiraceae bacterium]